MYKEAETGGFLNVRNQEVLIYKIFQILQKNPEGPTVLWERGLACLIKTVHHFNDAFTSAGKR